MAYTNGNVSSQAKDRPISSVLVTGGTGYLGSFTTLALLEAGYDVVVVDNLHNSSEESLNRIYTISGKRPTFYKIDITDEDALDKVFTAHPEITSVIHFAALKSVGESSDVPLEYYRTNVYGTIVLLRCMTAHNVSTIVFSSSATVYGDVTRITSENMIPIPEECPIEPTNPYGRTKSTVELIITDHFDAQNRRAEKSGGTGREWNAALLRYFNPCGAHPSGILGEDPQAGSLNLLPVLGHVAIGKLEKLLVFGDGQAAALRTLKPGWLTLDIDYASSDGTMIRDFIHVLDVADGHLSALEHLHSVKPGVRAWNLGSGRGTTVLEMLDLFSREVGHKLPYQIVGRRSGDVLNLTAKPSRAAEELGWHTKLSVTDAIRDFWRWISNNPDGFAQEPPERLLDNEAKGRP